jgi:POT family proton-dependent oligopeptide transporter
MPQSPDTRFFGHPAGLSTLFFTELWERFGYYGMRALLILFLVAPVAQGGLGLSDLTAGSIYGLYTASVYMASMPGGWLADRFLGQRKAVLLGGTLIAIGYLMLAVADVRVFYAGLCVVVCGTGLLKPNISTMVGQLYPAGDVRRDSGFSIFYMGINTGALIAPLICGYIGQRIDWHLGFGVAGLGMACGVVQFFFGRGRLGEAGRQPKPLADPIAAAAQRRFLRNAILGAVALGATLAALHLTGTMVINALRLVNALGFVLFGIAASVFSWLLFGPGWSKVERKRFAAILVLFVAACLFWAAYEQAGSSFNLFAERSTANTILGYAFPASWFQSMNSIFIVLLAPVLAWLWIWLGKRQPSSPTKFAMGLTCVGLGCVVLVPAAFLASHGARVMPWFLVITYLFHTIGELCLSPVGLSAITKLAPVRVASLLMGLWFITNSIGNYLAGRLASLYGEVPLPALFGITAGFSLVAALLLFAASKPVSRLIGDER